MNHYSLVEKRIRYVVAISLVLLIAFAVRLVDVQAVRAAGYANRADMELAKKSIIMAPRGAITDINGVEFARSVTAYRILADQAIIDYPQEISGNRSASSWDECRETRTRPHGNSQIRCDRAISET